jgi:hypothetical protein
MGIARTVLLPGSCCPPCGTSAATGRWSHPCSRRRVMTASRLVTAVKHLPQVLHNCRGRGATTGNPTPDTTEACKMLAEKILHTYSTEHWQQ